MRYVLLDWHVHGRPLQLSKWSQTEQDWAIKLKRVETDRDKALAAKDALLQQAMQKAQSEAQAALDRLRNESTAEAKRMAAKHSQEISTLQVCPPSSALVPEPVVPRSLTAH
jgi:hypothetical protein